MKFGLWRHQEATSDDHLPPILTVSDIVSAPPESYSASAIASSSSEFVLHDHDQQDVPSAALISAQTSLGQRNTEVEHVLVSQLADYIARHRVQLLDYYTRVAAWRLEYGSASSTF
jgi:hypothetical protein